MKKTFTHIFKYTLCFILVTGLLLSSKLPKSVSYAENNGKKAIIMILDMISLNELIESNTPNIDSLLDNGSIGLMNMRSRSRVSNKSSSYLSLGMGVKTLASANGNLASNRDNLYPLSDYKHFKESISAGEMYKLFTGNETPDGEIVNIAFGNVEKTALSITPNNQVGLLGKIARENNLKVGLLGNGDADSPSRESSLLAMDERGIIPIGNVGSDLLEIDTNVLGGLKLDQNKLLGELDRILPETDILFVDYGDPERIEKSENFATDNILKSQKVMAIERADSFLGEIKNRVDMNNTLFMIVTPNPSKETISNGNFALTPFIMSSQDTHSGLLTSDTTRREGLIANFDFTPTLLNYFNISDTSFSGSVIKTISSDDTSELLLKNEADFLYLRKYRRVFHWTFIVFAGISLVGLFLSKFTKWNLYPKKVLTHLSLTALTIPITMMLVSLFGYKSIILDILFVVIGAFLIEFTLNKILKNDLKVISIVSLATSLFLLIDIFFIEKLMIVSPLGSDAIAGGRFYGIGNDYMGILLGSTLLGIFSLFHIYKLKKRNIAIFTVMYMLVSIIALSPFFGANVGGTLSAMFVTLIALVFILNKKFSIKSIFLIGIGVFVMIILLAALDMNFNPNPTHAGKALEGLMTDGVSKFIEIVTIKLGQVFWNLAHASWNIILFLEILLTFLLYKFKKQELINLNNKFKRLLNGLLVILIGGVIVFLFNDTGTIAAAIMTLYTFIPLGLIMNKEE